MEKMDEKLFEETKGFLDEAIEHIVEDVLKGEKGKKILDQQVHELIESAGGSTNDHQVIREMTYMAMASIVKENDQILGDEFHGKNFIASVVGSLIVAYRLGQFNTSMQSEQRFENADRAVDKLHESNLIHDYKDGKIDFAKLAPEMRTIIMKEI
jgi:hypothetical protein